MLNARVIVGAAFAYACIREGTRTLDVQLSPGCAASTALQRAADEARADAWRALERAELMERGALLLAQQEGAKARTG
jgi:hypothetical protein